MIGKPLILKFSFFRRAIDSLCPRSMSNSSHMESQYIFTEGMRSPFQTFLI